MADSTRTLRLKHLVAIRWFHWVNFPLLSLMIWSGLLIYWAYSPYHIGSFHFFPDWFINALGIKFRLAEGMALHFFCMWFFVVNGILYVAYTLISGEWRMLVPRSLSVFRDAWHVLLHDLHLESAKPTQPKRQTAEGIADTSGLGVAVKDVGNNAVTAAEGIADTSGLGMPVLREFPENAMGTQPGRQTVEGTAGTGTLGMPVLRELPETQVPLQDKYNAAQQIAYTGIIVMGMGSFLTGLAIYKPAQVAWLTTLFGGYAGARLVHFCLTLGYVGFFGIHVTQVILAGWNNFRSMVIGYELVNSND
jgi:thiosulfate reductase cytochrome b subunit